ncbi:MAG: beta-ketoacyl-ACP synthase II [Cyanobacteria bacterium P01_H01_bin.74]
MASNQKRRVVITGMGAITPIGDTLESIWDSLKNGKSGIGPNTLLPQEEITCPIAGECTHFDATDYVDKKDAKRMDRFAQFGVSAAKLAYEDSGLASASIDPEQFGVIVSSAAGGIGTIETQLRNSLKRGFNKCSPFLVPMMICDIAGGWIAIQYNAKGINYSVVTACATGANSIGESFRAITNCEADVMIAGGAESPITSLSVAGFYTMRALSQRYDEPTLASRPFDKDRDGFVIAEGAGIVVLEELNHAKKRNAKIYGEIIGYGRTADANDIVAPCADGNGAGRAMSLAIKDAGIKPEAIDYINAHGTSTPLGDLAETLAIKRVFGDHAINNGKSGGVLVSSTKSMTGHMLGATGSAEAIFCLMAMEKKQVPPTINLTEPGEQCDLDYVPNQSRSVDKLDIVMSNSFGFGGHNASLIFKRYVE